MLLLLAAACLLPAVGKLTGNPKMRQSAAHFGIPWSRYQPAKGPGSCSGRVGEGTQTAILPQPAYPARPQVTAPAASSEAVQGRSALGAR